MRVTAVVACAAWLVWACVCARPAAADTDPKVAPDTVHPDIRRPAIEPTPTSKKQAWLEAKASARRPDAAEEARRRKDLDRRVGAPPDKVINIFNTWTHEDLPVAAVAPDKPGYQPIAADRVNRFLRCHFTNQSTAMDERLIQVLIAAAVHFDAPRVDIVSGYRSPKYNLILRKKGHEVSRNSQHPQGNAVDFRLPGVAVGRLHAWAKSLRLGGVGLYTGSGFIHVDTARVRYWTGR